jgi:hypothetical protein
MELEVSVCRDEDMIIAEIGDRREGRINTDLGSSAAQCSLAEIFKPGFRRLDALEQTMRAVIVRDRGALRAPNDDERTIEDAGVGARHAIGRADHGGAAACTGRADQAVALQGEAISAEAAGARGAPCVR